MYNLNDDRCRFDGQKEANDVNSGQFVDWNGPGQPYETGQGYLVSVLTANDASSATITLPDVTTLSRSAARSSTRASTSAATRS